MIPKFDKYLELAYLLKNKPESKHLHFSFIVKKNKIKAIGWNFAAKTHSLAFKYGYEFPFVHAELSAITRFTGLPQELNNCMLINVRINQQNRILNSRPCKNCVRLLDVFGISKVYFTGKLGNFEEL